MYKIFPARLFIIAFLLPLIFISSDVYAQRKKKKKDKKPEWVMSRPVDKDYYQGIGVAMVNNYTQGHVEEAKKKALNDIISEISVSIKTTNLMQQIERNDELNNLYQSMTTIKAENEIEGFELVDSWGDENEYWVYYQLSKELYYQNQLRRLNRAKAIGNQYYESGVASLQEGDIGRAYEDFVKGLVSMKEYVDEEITIVTDNGKEYLVDALMHQLIELNRNITISANVDRLAVRLASEVEEEILLDVKYKGQGISIPLKPRFIVGSGEVPNNILSDEGGKASFNIQRVTGGENQQVLEISLDIEGMTAEEEGNDMAARIVRIKCGVPGHKINIEAEKIDAYLETVEDRFNKVAGESGFLRSVKKMLSDNAYNFSESKKAAEVEIKVSIVARKGESYELKNKILYTSYVELYVGITDLRSGSQIFYKGFGDVKGSRSGSFEMALQEAERAALEKFKEELLPEISNIQLN